VDPSESYIDQIGFDCAALSKMIVSVWTLKSVKITFVMEHDQRMIIKLLENEGADARNIGDRLQTD
jgi:hypothetical protein